MTTSVTINAVDRAIDILNYIFDMQGDVSISQISKDLNIYKSTVYRTLVTLENRGYVEKNPETDRYGLGVQLFIIGRGIDQNTGIQKVLKPHAKKLYEEFHESVNVSVLECNENGTYYSVMIYKEQNNQILGFNSDLGSRNECYCAGVGKCLLAFNDKIDLSVYDKYPMYPYTEKTIRTRQELEEELVKVRQQGYALDDEEREKGLTCIGVPILDKNGHAVAAISLSGPTSRVKDSQFETKIKRLKEEAKEISDIMSFSILE